MLLQIEEAAKMGRAGIALKPILSRRARSQPLHNGLSRHKRRPPREARVPSIYSMIPLLRS